MHDQRQCLASMALTAIWSRAGHSATIHACTVEDNSLVGMKATLLDGVTVCYLPLMLIKASSCLLSDLLLHQRTMILSQPIINYFVYDEAAVQKQVIL